MTRFGRLRNPAAAPTLAAPISHNASGKDRSALETRFCLEELTLDALADLLSDAGLDFSAEELQDANLKLPGSCFLLRLAPGGIGRRR